MRPDDIAMITADAGDGPGMQDQVTTGDSLRDRKSLPRMCIDRSIVYPGRARCSQEASSSSALTCFSAMRVRSTRDLMSSLRNTWRRWNATVCVLMNS
jgi:hypothetical protein